MKWYTEIKEVGIKDWFWFVFHLRRNEFSKKLDLITYHEKYGCEAATRLMTDRHRAHVIDMKLSNPKVGK